MATRERAREPKPSWWEPLMRRLKNSPKTVNTAASDSDTGAAGAARDDFGLELREPVREMPTLVVPAPVSYPEVGHTTESRHDGIPLREVPVLEVHDALSLGPALLGRAVEERDEPEGVPTALALPADERDGVTMALVMGPEVVELNVVDALTIGEPEPAPAAAPRPVELLPVEAPVVEVPVPELVATPDLEAVEALSVEAPESVPIEHVLVARDEPLAIPAVEPVATPELEIDELAPVVSGRDESSVVVPASVDVLDIITVDAPEELVVAASVSPSVVDEVLEPSIATSDAVTSPAPQAIIYDEPVATPEVGIHWTTECYSSVDEALEAFSTGPVLPQPPLADPELVVPAPELVPVTDEVPESPLVEVSPDRGICEAAPVSSGELATPTVPPVTVLDGVAVTALDAVTAPASDGGIIVNPVPGQNYDEPLATPETTLEAPAGVVEPAPPESAPMVTEAIVAPAPQEVPLDTISSCSWMSYQEPVVTEDDAPAARPSGFSSWFGRPSAWLSSKQEFAMRWAAVLRSGKYEQACGVWKEEVVGFFHTVCRRCAIQVAKDEFNMSYTQIQDKIGRPACYEVLHRNDDLRDPFSETADFIEETFVPSRARRESLELELELKR